MGSGGQAGLAAALGEVGGHLERGRLVQFAEGDGERAAGEEQRQHAAKNIGKWVIV